MIEDSPASEQGQAKAIGYQPSDGNYHNDHTGVETIRTIPIVGPT